MEKSFEEVMVQFYVDQYRENAKRSTGKPVKLAHHLAKYRTSQGSGIGEDLIRLQTETICSATP